MANTPDPLKVLEMVAKADGKGMLSSKKFVGFMTIQLCGTALMFYAIYAGMSDAVLMTIQGSLGTAQTAYLGIQGWHDKHTKTAKMEALSATNGHSKEEPQ